MARSSWSAWSAWLSLAAWSAGYGVGKRAGGFLRALFFTIIRRVSLGLGLGIAGFRALLRAGARYRPLKRLKTRIE